MPAKLSWPRLRRRRPGGRAAKVDGLTRGDLALRLKGRRGSQAERSEKSAEAIVVVRGEGPNDGKGETPASLDEVMPQKSEAPSAQTAGAVKPQGPRLRVEASSAGSGDARLGSGDLMER